MHRIMISLVTIVPVCAAQDEEVAPVVFELEPATQMTMSPADFAEVHGDFVVQRTETKPLRKIAPKLRICDVCNGQFLWSHICAAQDDRYLQFLDLAYLSTERPVENVVVQRTKPKRVSASVKCALCPYVANTPSALRVHDIVHTDRPGGHRCLTCGASFMTQGALTKHQYLHFQAHS